MNKYQIGKANAQQEAIDWQNHFGDSDHDWLELAEASARFERVGKRYGLLKEFRENGII